MSKCLFTFHGITNITVLSWQNDYLIEHPLQPHSSRTFIFISNAEPVQILQYIQCFRDRGDITTPFFDRENLSIGANILMAIQQCFKPSTSQPLHQQDNKQRKIQVTH